MLTRLTTDLSDDEEAWMDEQLQTTPDCRLAAIRVPASADGSLRFSGVCSASGRTPPASVTLRVQRGPTVVSLTLPIPPPDGQMAVEEAAKGIDEAAMATEEAAKAEAVSVAAVVGSLGRLLQVQHTLLSLARLHEEHYDPEACAAAAAELACTCGIASEYSSLLKLSMAEQEPEP